MNPQKYIFLVACTVWIVSPPVLAQQETVSPSLVYPRVQVTSRDADVIRRDRIIKVPKAERPENNVSDMSPKAREQFERNEAEMRRKLEDNAERWDKEYEWRRKHLRRDHDADHDRDRRKWKSTTAMQNGAFVPQTVRADKDRRAHRHRRHHRHYRYNYHTRVYLYEPVTVVVYEDDPSPVEIVPKGYDRLDFGGVTYYFKDGQFYVPSNGNIVEVQPPLGAVVPRMPEDAVIIESNGTYYVYNGIYYRQTWGGFEVIAPPFDPREYSRSLMPSNVSPDIYVRLPDLDGGVTEIKLIRTTRGFKGPQGELYSEFPPIEQLQEMYGNEG